MCTESSLLLAMVDYLLIYIMTGKPGDWFHQATSSSSIDEKLSQVNAWTIAKRTTLIFKSLCLSQSGLHWVAELPAISDNISTAGATGSYFSIVLFSSHMWQKHKMTVAQKIWQWPLEQKIWQWCCNLSVATEVDTWGVRVKSGGLASTKLSLPSPCTFTLWSIPGE